MTNIGASTYNFIASQTLGSAASSVTFNSIPQTYTDLVCVTQNTSLTNNPNYVYIYVQFNGDTGNNYSTTSLSGDGSSATSRRFTSRGDINLAYTASPNSTAPDTNILQIMNYSNTTTYKTALSRAGRANAGTDATVGLWRNTAAITSLVIGIGSDSFATGSTFTLYGIQAAAVSKAYGGTVTTDSTYTYHTFTSSGLFTTLAPITADILVVAGGGGGGYGGIGAGAGAGGLLFQSGRVVNFLTSYTVTVGAGGPGANSSTGRGTNGNNSIFDTITGIGGGAGGGESTGASGGSGGGGTPYGAGGSSQNYAGGSATQGNSGGATGYGNAGAAGSTGGGYGGGGGGAGAAATNATGGVGLSGTTIATIDAMGAATSTGQLSSGHYYYAGGGGGSGGSNGLGNGAVNTGGGGLVNTSGYSGIVIVRYLTNG